MSSGQIFSKSLHAWAEKAKNGLDGLARVSCQDLAEEVIDTTPVDTGFLVGNWQPSLETPVLNQEQAAKGKATAAVKLGVVVAQIKAGMTFYYVNNAAYAMRIEFGFVGADSLGRVYNQPGRHMVTVAIKRWDRIVAGAAKKLGIAA